MNKLKPTAAALGSLTLAASLVFPLTALAEPSTCWKTREDPTRNSLEPFECDVELINKHNPDATYRRTGKSYWRVMGMKVFTDHSTRQATVVFPDGSRKLYGFEIDKDLDWVLTGKQNWTFAFAPSEDFKRFVRGRLNNNNPTQPARYGSSRPSDVLSDTPFRF